jgi:heat shock protein HslJ
MMIETEKQSMKLGHKHFLQRQDSAPRRWIAMVLVLGLLVSACTPVATPTQAPAPAPAQATPAVDLAPGQTLLANTMWILQSYGDPNNPTPVEQGTQIDALFSATLTISGSSGCNSYTGRYAIQGNKLQYSLPIVTSKSCPQGMQQEATYLSALGSSVSYQIRGANLEITYDNGKGLLKYSASALPGATTAP